MKMRSESLRWRCTSTGLLVSQWHNLVLIISPCEKSNVYTLAICNMLSYNPVKLYYLYTFDNLNETVDIDMFLYENNIDESADLNNI